MKKNTVYAPVRTTPVGNLLAEKEDTDSPLIPVTDRTILGKTAGVIHSMVGDGVTPLIFRLGGDKLSPAELYDGYEVQLRA